MGHFWKCLFSVQKGWANDDNMLFFRLVNYSFKG